jgi:hypothetical protein
MKQDSALFSAMLGDDVVELREATRRRVISLARRRRLARGLRRGAMVAAAVAVGFWATSRWSQAPIREEDAPKGVAMVDSQPLASAELVRTTNAAFARVTSEFREIALVDSRPMNISIVETRLAMPEVDFLTDRELLAALAGQRAALIDPGTDRARVIFY